MCVQKSTQKSMMISRKLGSGQSAQTSGWSEWRLIKIQIFTKVQMTGHNQRVQLSP